MIHRLWVTGYKSLDAEIEFHPLTVVFGPNAAGKSNLLDLLGLLSRMVTEETLDGAFAEHRGTPLEAFTFGDEGLPGLQRKESAQFRLILDVELSEAVVDAVEEEIRQAREGLGDDRSSGRRKSVREQLLRYTLAVQIITRTGHLRVVDEKLEALKSDGTPSRSRKPFLETLQNEQVLRIRMERQGRPRHEEIGQDRTVVSKALYPPHHPHVVAFREELSRWRFYFLSPAAMRTEVPVQSVDTLGPDGGDIAAFFNTLKATNELQFRTLSKILRQVVTGLDQLDVERTEQGLLRLMVHERGMPLSSRLISEGTLRVLGLLAITNPLEPMSVVGYEEPENGVHPSRLSVVARLLEEAASRGATQFILNTHSPVLPEHFQFVDRAGLIRCWKRGRATQFERFEEAQTLMAGPAIEHALGEAPVSSLRDRIVRGDLA